MSNGNTLTQGLDAGPKKPHPNNPLLEGIETPVERPSGGNPLLQGMTGPKPPPPEPGLAERLVRGLVIEPLKDVSAFIKHGLMSGAGSRMPSPYGQEQAVQETSEYIAGLPPEELARVQRGAALAASFAGAPVIEAAPVVGPLLGKWGSFLTGEFLGGNIYGAIRPLEEGESRASAVLGDGALFAATGGLFKGTGELATSAFKRYILNMPSAKRKIALGLAKAARSKLDLDLGNGGVNLEQIPPEQAAKLEEPILREAIQQADPNVKDLDAIIKQESDRAIEPNPRFAPEQAKIDLPAPIAETPIWQQFNNELDKLRELPDEALGKRPKLEESAAAPAVRDAQAAAAGEKMLATERRKELQPVAKERRAEKITGVAVKGRSGKLYPAAEGEVTHPQIMARAIESGTPVSEFIDERTGAYASPEMGGYKTSTREFVSKEEATRIGLEGATVREQIVGPTVKGKSGKLYVGGATHPETMEQAVAAGTDPAEFESIGADHPNRGFKTNVHDFVSREYAGQLSGTGGRLFSEDMHKIGMLPSENPVAAETNLENTVKVASAEKDVPHEVLLDAITDHAVASTKPLDVSSIGVRGNKELIEQTIAAEPHPIQEPSEKTRHILEKALERESPAAEQGVVLEMTQPLPAEIAMTKKIPAYVQKQFRRELEQGKTALAKSLAREKPPIEVAPGEQVGAPWTEPAEQLISPKEMDGFEIGAHVSDKELDDLKDSLLKIVRNQSGRVSARLMIATTGSAMEALSTNDNLSPAEKTGLRALGAFMILAAVHPRLAEVLKKNNFVRKFLLQYNPTKVMADEHHPELFRQYVEAMTSSRLDNTLMRDRIRDIFKSKESWAPAMFAAEEGANAPEWHLLSPSQQQAALVLNQMELRRGMILKREGVLDEYIDNYVRHLLPPKSYETWRTRGFKVLPVGGAFTKPRRINTLRELVEWTKKEGLEPPVMDPGAVYAFHGAEADRSLAVVRLRNSLDRVGLIQDFNPHKPIPEKWRPISVMGMSNKIAPEEIAHALENISSPRSSSIEIVNSMDQIKGLWMRSIMIWPWEHGFNVLRSIPAIASNPSGFGDIWRAVKLRDPGMKEAAQAGADLFSRPDYGVRSHEAWQKLFSIAGLPKVGAAVDRKFEMMDKWLWEQVVPSLQYFAYSTQMHSWAERTKGRFLPASAEYKAARRAAADFSNVVAGRIPQELTNPGLARLMRFAMFSPQWTTTRMALITHAAGELSEIAAGKLDPRDAAYLPFKMRQLAWGIAITWLGSRLMSGKDPQFNPNSSKFYMKTGLRNAKGQEIGLDIIGWWETDLQVFNHPFNFMFNRLNPAVKIAGETIQGRDYLGREMTTGQTIGNILSSFGAGFSFATTPIRMAARAAQGPPIRGGELLQQASQATGAFNVATLPRPIDAAIGKYAKKLLITQGIPATNDNVFQLSRLLRGNLLNGRELIDNGVINWLGYYKRSDALRNPITSAIKKGPPIEEVQGLWQEARRVLAEF